MITKSVHEDQTHSVMKSVNQLTLNLVSLLTHEINIFTAVHTVPI